MSLKGITGDKTEDIIIIVVIPIVLIAITFIPCYDGLTHNICH